MILSVRDTADCETGGGGSNMGSKISKPNRVEASIRPELGVSIPSLPSTLPAVTVTVSRSESSSSLDSADSEVESSSSSDVSELLRVFRILDEDHDNFIGGTDLRRFMARLGFALSEEEAAAMLQTVDKSGDGRVTIEEFCTLYQQQSEPCSDAEELTPGEGGDSIRQAFRVFDKNEDGVITAKELQVVLVGLGRPEGTSIENCERMIQGVDMYTEGNGPIDIHKFRQMMSPNFLHEKLAADISRTSISSLGLTHRVGTVRKLRHTGAAKKNAHGDSVR